MNMILRIAKNKEKKMKFISIIFLSLSLPLTLLLMISISKIVSNFSFHCTAIYSYVNELTFNVTFHMNINKSRMKKILRYCTVATAAEFLNFL